MEKGAMLVGWDLFMKDVKIEPAILKGQGSVARALASGKVDVGYLTFSVFARVVAKGAKLVSLAVSEQKLVWGVIAKKGIKSIKALKGKKIAVHAHQRALARRLSTTTPRSVRLQQEETIFQMYYIRGGENRIAALLAGKLDATVAALIDANQANQHRQIQGSLGFRRDSPRRRRPHARRHAKVRQGKPRHGAKTRDRSGSGDAPCV